ncbi:E3 ubiquitin-protein ligase RMA1H1-like [Impatiens glandulifera]|uniref:E3 ubiquitin-protein ligase RMA1H1-like n=1 Tax=Impatiens glandulifera TaxID=253017 RepID=UPI001FB1623B|nr:E3 ubiquitin-protein ligase RMA1H1-like [Impatiens glandulifera]
MEQYYEESMMFDTISLKNCKSVSSKMEEEQETREEVNLSGGFDCNICLGLVQDPVVTLCGHLYCWPCIYKWISSNKTEPHNPQCPVCRSDISEKMLIPLYNSQNQSAKPSNENSSNLGNVIPNRPSFPHGATISQQQRRQQYSPPQSGGFQSIPIFGVGRSSGDGEYITTEPMFGMYGERVYARFFGNSEASVLNSYNHHIEESGNPRLRRHLLETDKSLDRVCLFLFCFVIFCLLLF